MPLSEWDRLHRRHAVKFARRHGLTDHLIRFSEADVENAPPATPEPELSEAEKANIARAFYGRHREELSRRGLALAKFVEVYRKAPTREVRRLT